MTTRGARRLTGRLVYELDESETTETLDAPSQGVDYTIPFGLIASITPVGQEERGTAACRGGLTVAVRALGRRSAEVSMLNKEHEELGTRVSGRATCL